jgi:dihydroorotate dehydrogenase
MIYQLLKPLLFRVDAERAHELVADLFRQAPRAPLASALLGGLYGFHSPLLASSVAGLRFANPLGLAAGFDKRGELVDAMALLGFGHIEVGTVTPRPQPGNPQPRLFRLPADEALVNRMGFNSPGMLAVAGNLGGQRSVRKGRHAPVIGVNIGKNRDTPLERATEDYLAAFMALAPLADYVTVNISSPNTPGLRRLHERAALEELLGALKQENDRLRQPRPLFLKISPDETPAAIEEVVRAGLDAGCAGFVATNTTLAREALRGKAARESGGLSGRPLAPRARETVARVYMLTAGAVPVIGVGGVSSAADAYAMIRAGASLVQLYTGLVYRGPGIVRMITTGLVQLLWRDGCRSVADAVGADITI